MARYKDPTRHYENTACNTDPNLRLFGIQDDGVGNKGLGLQVYLDRERYVLYPMRVYAATPASNGKN